MDTLKNTDDSKITECTSDENIRQTDYTVIRSKNALVNPTEIQHELLLKRLKERIHENILETIYDIGIGEGM